MIDLFNYFSFSAFHHIVFNLSRWDPCKCKYKWLVWRLKSPTKSVSADRTNIYISVHRWSKYDKVPCLGAQAGVRNQQRNMQTDTPQHVLSMLYQCREKENAENSAFDMQSSSVIKLNNSTILYLKEVNKYLALVCILREDSYDRQGKCLLKLSQWYTCLLCEPIFLRL